jgi:hypothetical protein
LILTAADIDGIGRRCESNWVKSSLFSPERFGIDQVTTDIAPCSSELLFSPVTFSSKRQITEAGFFCGF